MIRTRKRLLQMGCGESLSLAHGNLRKRTATSEKSRISEGLLPLPKKNIRGLDDS